MTSWKPLPDGLEPDVRDLVEQLRRLKDRSRLSLGALAERTLHSKSSWERYLNGKALPPRLAVAALAQVAGAEPARLDALWDLAERAWHGRNAARQQAPGSPDSSSSPLPDHEPLTVSDEEGTRQDSPHEEASVPDSEAARRAGRRRPASARGVAAVAAGLALAAGVLVLSTWSSHDGSPSDAAPEHGTGSRSASGQLDTRCFEGSCTGQDPQETGCGGDAWTAALSRTHGVYVELRYSDTCKAAWARISWGVVGDIARVVTTTDTTREDKVHYDTDVYSPMVAADTPADARACTILTSGSRLCTKPGGTVRLTEPPEPTASESTHGR